MTIALSKTIDRSSCSNRIDYKINLLSVLYKQDTDKTNHIDYMSGEKINS